MNKSPEIGMFHIQNQLKRLSEGEATKQASDDIIAIFKTAKELKEELEQSEHWKQNNLEYDLRSNSWICDKAKLQEHYAQNLYAALCNNEFIKNDVWPLLQDKRWSCSWRSAGGIVANMREEGDYIDWYCSGIKHTLTDEEYQNLSESAKSRYDLIEKFYVDESTVTEEIKNDLLKLGWIVIQDDGN